MKLINIIILMTASAHLYCQTTLDAVLENIERNNTTLSAINKSIEAEKAVHKTVIRPSNPEVEFNYLWGNPSYIGNRTNFAVSSTFDFPSAYLFRSDISELRIEQSNLEFKKQRLELLHNVRLLCGEIIYHNILYAEYTERVENARIIADNYRKKLNAGETNILEYNKSQVYLLNLSKKTEIIEIERKALLDELAKLNGGKELMFTDTVFVMPLLLSGFEEWYAHLAQNNPVLQWLDYELTISKKKVKLNVAQSLPKFSTGYMSEAVGSEQFKGLKFGVSIPLWENKNLVKSSKAMVIAAEEMEADAVLQFYSEMKSQYNKVVALQNSIYSYRKELEQYSNSELISKALETGEISLNEYYNELGFYYESIDKLIEMELLSYAAYNELLKYR